MDKPTTRKKRAPASKPRSTARPTARKKAPQTGARASSTAVAARKHPAAKINLDVPELYLNRELTWLEFNRRVLHMAADGATPLLERVKFLAIVSANLDEFFMKRIGGLK